MCAYFNASNNAYKSPISRTTARWLICILGFGATFFYLHDNKQKEYKQKQFQQEKHSHQKIVYGNAHDALDDKIHKLYKTQHTNTTHEKRIDTNTHSVAQVSDSNVNSNGTDDANIAEGMNTDTAPITRDFVDATLPLANDTGTSNTDTSDTDTSDTDTSDTGTTGTDEKVHEKMVEQAVDEVNTEQAKSISELITQDSLLNAAQRHKEKATRMLDNIGPELQIEDIAPKAEKQPEKQEDTDRFAKLNDKLHMLQTQLSQQAFEQTELLYAMFMFDAKNILQQQQTIEDMKQKSTIFARIPSIFMPLNTEISALFVRPHLELTLSQKHDGIATYYSEIRNVVQLYVNDDVSLQLAVDKITPMLMQMPYLYLHNSPYVHSLTEWMQCHADEVHVAYQRLQKDARKDTVSVLQDIDQIIQISSHACTIMTAASYAMDLSMIYGAYCTGTSDAVIIDDAYSKLIYEFAQRALLLLQSANALQEVIKYENKYTRNMPIFQKQDLQDADLFHAYANVSEAYEHKVRPWPFLLMPITPPEKYKQYASNIGIFEHSYRCDDDQINVMVKYFIFIHPLKQYFQYNENTDTVTLKEDNVDMLLHNCVLLLQEVSERAKYLEQHIQNITTEDLGNLLNINVLAKKIYALNLYKGALNEDDITEEYGSVASHIECDDILSDEKVLNKTKFIADFLANTNAKKV